MAPESQLLQDREQTTLAVATKENSNFSKFNFLAIVIFTAPTQSYYKSQGYDSTEVSQAQRD